MHQFGPFKITETSHCLLQLCTCCSINFVCAAPMAYLKCFLTASPEGSLHPCRTHAINDIGCQPEGYTLWCTQEEALLKSNAQVNVQHLAAAAAAAAST